jgi:hypothetical protein
MPKPENRKLERVQYWQGQTLRAQDFLNLQRVEAQRRWWHNRAVHNAYGVAEGLIATLNGSKVSVSPGVAYDIFGRELILETPQVIPVPSNFLPGLSGGVSLLMRYKPPARGMQPDEASDVCWTAPGSVAAGTAEFVWKIGDRLNPADGVAVFAVNFTGGTLTGPDPNYIRISAEPLARPLLASGATVPGETPWEWWTAGFDGNLRPYIVGEQTWIDTSAAGFTDVPCYFAWLQGPLFSSQPQLFLPALLTNIADASIIGFTFQLCLPGLGPTVAGGDTGGPEFVVADISDWVTPNDFNLFAKQQKLYVSWIGCQTLGKACACSQDGTSAANESSALSKKS